jgi:hypothetical protein
MINILLEKLWRHETRLTKITIVVILSLVIGSQLGLLALHIVNNDWH